MFGASKKTTTSLKILDITAFFLLLAVTVLWAVWGVGEVFHEGWYQPYWHIVYYFIPFIAVFGFSVLAIFFPLVGGILILSGGIAYLVIFMIQSARAHQQLEVSFFLMISAVVITGLLFIFIYILKKKAGSLSYSWHVWKVFKNHPVFRRTIKIIIIAGISLVLIIGIGTPMLIRNLGRIPLEDLDQVNVEGNGIEAVFAGEGPGWYFTNEKPLVYEGMEYSGLSWNEIALYGMEPVGFQDKRYGTDYDGSTDSIYFATRDDFEKYNMFRHISYDGAELTGEIQDWWRLPSADEFARLLTRVYENAGGYFDEDTKKAYYEIAPDKEAPLWAPEEMVIYYWTSTGTSKEEAYDIVYSGEVREISKITKQDYRGWRAIRTDKRAGQLVRMTVESVELDRVSGSPVVLLKKADDAAGDTEDAVYLPIWIGNTEAISIALALAETEYPRPMTHDLMANILDSLSVQVTSVEINNIFLGTYYALINLKMPDGTELAVDSRPSDAIAIALRADCYIFTSSIILDVYGVKLDTQEEDVLRF